MSILDTYTYITITSEKQLRHEISTMVIDPLVGVDTETTSLKYYEQKIESVQLAASKKVLFIPLLIGDVYNMNLLLPLQDIMNKSPWGVWIFHNAPFDLAALHKIGIYYEGTVGCTMTMAHLLNETRTKALKEIAHGVFNTKIISYSDVSHLARSDVKFIQYASHDAIYCRELYPMMYSSLQEHGQEPLWVKIESKFQHVLKEMRIKGLPADKATAHKLQVRATELQRTLLKKCHEAAGLRCTEQCDLLGERFIQSKWNFNSSTQLIDIIENKLGLEITETTDKGAKSVGKKTKARLKNKHDFIKQLDLYGKVSKSLSGFLEPFDDYVDGDGRMRSDFNNTGTVTGRPSSSDPNLLQLPKDNAEIDINFRECFVAPAGKAIIASDFSGQELRGLGELSRDPKLLNCFAKGLDIHLMVANEMFKLQIPEADQSEKSPNYEAVKEKYKKERHIAKNGIVFPLIYGSTAKGISENLNISMEEAQGYIDRFFQSFPQVKKLIDATRYFIIKHGYAVNKSGRRRHFEKEYGKYNNGCFRQGFNFLIQSMAADMTKICCVNIRKEFKKHPEWDAIILMEVYDEIVVEANEEFLEPIKKVMRDKMLSSYKMSVPLEVSIGSGKNYQGCK